MANWEDATLSSSTTLAQVESEINSLTSSDWSAKIALAKEEIGDRLEVYLKGRYYDEYIDFEDDEDIKDLVSNPTVFNRSSDYYTLYLIYEDLAQGKSEGAYYTKKVEYKQRFEDKINIDLQRISISTDLDSDAEYYMQDIRRSRSITR